MDISFIIRAKLIIGSLFKSTAFFKVNIFVICIKKMVYTLFKDIIFKDIINENYRGNENRVSRLFT